jgi:CRP-like cAMP-binding protein
MAFGAGALLFALSIEIVAHSYESAGFAPLALGCVAGGLLFELLNQIINRRGGFLRKAATLLYHVTRLKRLEASEVIGQLAKMEVFRALPPDEIAKLIPQVESLELPAGAELLREGETLDALYLVDAGSVDVSRERGSILVTTLGPGAVLGEMELLTGGSCIATVRIGSEGARLYRVRREDFERLLAASPRTREIVEQIANAKAEPPASAGPSELAWRQSTLRQLHRGDLAPTRMEIEAVTAAHAGTHGSAVLGIWLGNLLDAIPESLVIGLSIVGASAVPWGLVASVFLANLPEAMSSSVVMRQQKFSATRILGLWSVIVLLSAFGAAFGNAMLRGLSPSVFAVIEGCAAGAMLTSIAETMLPEAYEQGGWVVGLSTLAGFLAALGVKALSGQ